jgi:hypothetical protein
LPALRVLAQRYGAPPVRAPMMVADVGAVPLPARVVLEEEGVPLAVERPLGTGRLVFLTFDPTRPPFRGSSLERPFWQEWLANTEPEYWDVGFVPETSTAYERARRRLALAPLSLGAMIGIWLGYLLTLGLVLTIARHRARALLVLSGVASLGALALGPALHGVRPAAIYERKLQVASGGDEGWWWGQARLMMPRSGSVTLQPFFQRWVPALSGLDGPGRLTGGIEFEVELEGRRLFARVRNQAKEPVRDLVVVWGRSLSLRLGDLPPGRETRRELARIGMDGEWTGAQDGVPQAYGHAQRSGGPVNPLLLHPPALLAHAAVTPPRLWADRHAIGMQGETALLVVPAGYRLRGAFHLPREPVAARMVTAQGPYGWWGRREWWGRLTLEPGARATFELQLPAGAGRARWRALALLLDKDRSLSARLHVFDWARQEWMPVAQLQGYGPTAPPARVFPQQIPDPTPASSAWQAIPLRSPERFVNLHTDTVLVRIGNESERPGGVDLGMSGDGESR